MGRKNSVWTLAKGLLLCGLFTMTGIASAQTSSINSFTPSGLTGTASSTTPIAFVDISIRSGSLYWNGSGFTSAWARVRAAVNATGNTANWSYSISPSLPVGFYSISSRAIDTAGNVQGPLTTASKTFDTIKPTSNITSATATAVAGVASDNFKLGRVEVAVRNSSAQYWNGSAFTQGYKRITAALQANGSWSIGLSPTLSPGRYVATSIAFDIAGNAQAAPYSNQIFNVADSVLPLSTIVTTNASTIAGTASDNDSISRVELALRNSSGNYWNGTAFAPGYRRVQANVTQNGNAWSYAIAGSLPPGNYVAVAIAFDASNNAQAAPYSVKAFTVTPTDGANPTIAFSSPTNGSTQTQTFINLFGSATDDVAVNRVELAIRNNNLNQYWNGIAWQPAYIRVPATTPNAGTTGTSWSYPISIDRGISLAITAFAFDNAGKFSTATISTGVLIKIMALGDSITEGILGEKSYRFPFTNELTQAGCVYQMVGSKTQNETPTSFVSPHDGHSGDPVDFFLTPYNNPGIDSIMNASPDVVMVHLGSNDMNRSQSITGTVNELTTLVNRIWAANPNAEVYLANVIPWFGTSVSGNPNPNISADIATLGDDIETKVASINDPRLHLVDVRSGYQQSYMISDLIHPNSDGEAHIADAFLASLSSNGVCP